MGTVRLPHQFEPYPYQVPVMAAFDRGVTRGVWVVHRRGGKDKTLFNAMVKAAALTRGTYFYGFPTYNQGRKVLWEAVIQDATSGRAMRYLDHVPRELRLWQHDSDMQLGVRSRDGGESVIQVVGCDQPDRLRGTNPRGLVFSEWSAADPRAWEVLRPVLAQNGGWAWFIFTPLGRGHGWTTWSAAQHDPAWFRELLTVDQTRDHAGRLIIAPEAIEAERRAGMSEDFLQQEFYCSFEAGLVGSYYGPQLAQARADGRIGRVPWDPALDVLVGWDLGLGDATALWFVQVAGREVRWIDYYEAAGVGLDHYVKVLKDRPYAYARFALPHDAEVRDYTTGVARVQRLRERFPGVRLQVLPNLGKRGVDDGIDAMRALFARSWFDESKCARGLDALAAYRKAFDETTHTFADHPYHDWASDGADAARAVAVALKGGSPTVTVRAPAYAETAFDPLGYDRDPRRMPAVAETEFDPFGRP